MDGVFAAGDAMSPMQSVTVAAGHGAAASYMINHELATGDARAALEEQAAA